MSQQLISHSPDLRRLREAGYSVRIVSNHLVVDDVPYVTDQRQVETGTLVSELTLAGNVTNKPKTHVVMFSGTRPCNSAGNQLAGIVNSSSRREIAPGLVVHYDFSSKPAAGYANYYDKMTTYATLLCGPAQALDPNATPRKYKVIENDDEDSVFHYAETASSRVGITAVSHKLALGPVAVIGVGGTGGYIADLLAKTPAREIHLFDEDLFLQHNAFRSPGAPSLETLRTVPVKSLYFRDIYSNMRRDIFAHDNVSEATADQLQGMEFAFVAVDDGAARKFIVKKLRKCEIPFIVVGMGILEVEGSLLGQLMVATWTGPDDDSVLERISYEDTGENDYSTNIQIADLNSLNAALAVIKWKKTLGFYQDLGRENLSYYLVDGNRIINENAA